MSGGYYCIYIIRFLAFWLDSFQFLTLQTSVFPLFSLSDLCNFAGVDYESENDSDEWQSTGRRSASLSSEMSALSCVSVLPSEELDRLLDDVRSLGDGNLQVQTAGHR